MTALRVEGRNDSFWSALSVGERRRPRRRRGRKCGNRKSVCGEEHLSKTGSGGGVPSGSQPILSKSELFDVSHRTKMNAPAPLLPSARAQQRGVWLADS